MSSAAMLFVELVLIRWVGENVVYVSYFTNFVLLASFLGVGLGFLAGPDRRRWVRHVPYLLLGIFGFVMVFPIRIDRSVADVLLLGSGETSGIPIWIVLPFVFVAAAAVMAAMGQEVARYFSRFEALVAYRLDILGSMSGIAVFTVLAFLNARPIVWAIIAAALILFTAHDTIVGPRRLALAGVVLLLGVQSFLPGLTWSPYYQLTVAERGSMTSIAANKIPHQVMAPVDDLRAVDWMAGWPYEVRSISDSPRNVLIIGAGSGNDVAYALDEGATHVDAVEIDPKIQALGVLHHPDTPYDDSRVSVHINDGRAYLEQTDREYDLILFALTDSLTLISGQSSLRLESYLFTIESVQRATELLSDTGVLAFYNLHSEDWIIARMADTLRVGSGEKVCAVGDARKGVGVMLAVGPGLSDSCGQNHPPPTGDLAPPTDDAPFLYVKAGAIPPLYIWMLVFVIAVAALSVRAVAGSYRCMRPYADLFLMGVGFLLLETKGVVQFALWFGSTWMVNAFVFLGILFVVWLAIEAADKLDGRVPLSFLYVLVLLALAVSWAVPPEWLLELSTVPRLLAATVITFGPVFAANLVFADRFKGTSRSTFAFGANLLGAMVGGVLEYASLITGHRDLVIIAGLAYLGAFLIWKRTSPDSHASVVVSVS